MNLHTKIIHLMRDLFKKRLVFLLLVCYNKERLIEHNNIMLYYGRIGNSK